MLFNSFWFRIFFSNEIFFPKKPYQENDSVENIFKKVCVEEVKPPGVIFDADNNKKDPDKVKYIYHQKAQRDIPDFFIPGTLGESKNTKTDICLFDTCTCPNDLYGIAVWIAEYVGWLQGCLWAKEVQDSCCNLCYMMCHPCKRSWDIHAPESNQWIHICWLFSPQA